MANRPLTPAQKQALAALRQRLGGVSEAKRRQSQQLRTARKAIRQQLVTGPATVPELAHAVHLPAHEVLWHVTGMRKYGEVREEGEADDYIRYALVAAPDAAPTTNQPEPQEAVLSAGS